MPKLILYLVTYDRGLHPFTGRVKPYHWAYFLETAPHSSGAPGTIFQLRGMPGGFHYRGPERLVVSQDGGPGELKDKLEVGEVEVVGDNANDVQEAIVGIHEALREVEIITDESVAWNCQNWSLRGFERLKQRGVVYEYLAQESVKGWLKER
ncbi:hypothetical protein C7999DRAFT_32337 [Corynascus novoguineensis]|uniref:Uncharacterized protein n=1 Tax=Corynascus novoguineensis TaxID=1126955 RepID=A0AAN7CSS7_9PEZI|nr:hypothetical protein C7999DRAFT_32337 [Corynascus novoguineensis]